MTSPVQTHPKSKSAKKGFTLIEVTLALGITAVALIALLAMVPQGLLTMKVATDVAIEARIHQQITSEVSSAGWADRFEFDDTIRYYDDQGIELGRGTIPTDEEPIYVALVHVPARGNSLPDSLGQSGNYNPIDFSGDTTDENEVQLVLVEVSAAPNIREKSDFENPDNFGNINHYISTLTRFTDFQSLQSAP